MSQLRKLRKRAKPRVVCVLDDKVNALLRRGLPEVPEGQDLYLTVVAAALGVTYTRAESEYKAGNKSYIAARNDVKRKLFSIVYSNGMAL